MSRLVRAVGRRLQPLLNPDAEQQRDQLDALIRDQKTRLESLEKRAAVQEKQAERALEALGALRREEVKGLRAGVAGLDAHVRRALGFSDRVLKRVTDRQQEWRAERALDRLQRLAAGAHPILVGPWTGEVGFELIYWVPFVRWFAAEYDVDPARFIIVSRGGTEPWYAGVCGRYLDAFELATPDEFRQATGDVKKKQRTVRLFDRQILRRAAARVAASAKASAPEGARAGLLHPALMYHLMTPFWRRAAGPALPAQYGRYRRYDPLPIDPALRHLPDRYVAARFYFSDCFPATDANRAFVRRTIEALAQHTDVVVIAPGVRVDDHTDAIVGGSPRVHVVADLPPARNLALQTAVISRAQMFVGTYGGFSYLAPLYGVDSVAFYSEGNFYRHHLLMAQDILSDVGGGTLTPLDVADMDRVRQLVAVEPAVVPRD